MPTHITEVLIIAKCDKLYRGKLLCIEAMTILSILLSHEEKNLFDVKIVVQCENCRFLLCHSMEMRGVSRLHLAKPHGSIPNGVLKHNFAEY